MVDAYISANDTLPTIGGPQYAACVQPLWAQEIGYERTNCDPKDIVLDLRAHCGGGGFNVTASTNWTYKRPFCEPSGYRVYRLDFMQGEYGCGGTSMPMGTVIESRVNFPDSTPPWPPP